MLIKEYCSRSKFCDYCCPWLKTIKKGDQELLVKCETYKEFEANQKTVKILKQSGYKFDFAPRIEWLEHNINNMAPVIARLGDIKIMSNGIVMLISRHGTGKSHILAGLLFQYVLRNIGNPYYVTASKMRWVAGNVAGMSADETAVSMNRKIQNSSILMIDELGREGETSPTFENYLNSILDSDRKIYIATNYFLDGEYALKYSSATMSRLRKSVIVKWEGQDYRKLK